MHGSHSYHLAVSAVLVFSSCSAVMAVDESWIRFPVAADRSIELRPVREGDYQWFESRDGFAVVRTPDRYEYAFQTEDGGIVPSGVIAGVPGRTLPFPPKILPTPEFLRTHRNKGIRGGSPPSPHPVHVRQPDGIKLELYLKGGSGMSWYEDKAGYTILIVPGRFEYAVRSPEGELTGCGIEVDTMKPADAGLVPGIRPGSEFLTKRNKPSDD